MTDTITEPGPALPEDLPALMDAPDSDDDLDDHGAQHDSDDDEPPPLEDANEPATKDAQADATDAPRVFRQADRLLGGPTYRGEKAYNTDASVLPFLHGSFPIAPTSSYDVFCQYPITYVKTFFFHPRP
ncbi:hypothetical protein FB45DRAFT_1017947 [Roridomyces roridus]|uniref:Uncharacterized protein n=1 Tax=Roridomyces roridus TaxID=1738132 RepID=A0AAD7G2M0_9AGAR|nr:hypothetical protein FB45DRAFT_1017947 [Roridomyces roridus]